MIPFGILLKYPELQNPNLSELMLEAVRLYGVYEYRGRPSNPMIMQWAFELAQAGYADFASYTSDDLPWCSMFMSIVAHRAGYVLPRKPNWSQAWRKFGDKVGGTSQVKPEMWQFLFETILLGFFLGTLLAMLVS